MEYGAIDLHKKESQVRIITAEGDVLDRRILTTRDRLTAVFGGRAPMRILIAPGRLDQERLHVRMRTAQNPPAVLVLAGAVLAWHQTQIAGHLRRAVEPRGVI